MQSRKDDWTSSRVVADDDTHVRFRVGSKKIRPLLSDAESCAKPSKYLLYFSISLFLRLSYARRTSSLRRDENKVGAAVGRMFSRRLGSTVALSRNPQLMPKRKFYAVSRGRETGVFTSWNAASRAVSGFPGAKHKSFSTRQDASSYLRQAASVPDGAKSTRALSTSARDDDDETPPTGKHQGSSVGESFSSVVSQLDKSGQRALHGQVYFDGGSKGNPGRGGNGYRVLRGDAKETFGWHFMGSERVTNNEAEYFGLINGLKCALDQGIENVFVRGDSELVLSQLAGTYKVKSPNLKEPHALASALLGKFRSYELMSVPRLSNKTADAMANYAMDSETTGEATDDPNAAASDVE